MKPGNTHSSKTNPAIFALTKAKTMIRAGIIGGTGYVAGELLRLLVNHPEVSIDFVYSHSQPGQSLASVHGDLIAYPEIRFTDRVNTEVDVLFLCLGHGHSRAFLEKYSFPASTRVIDLGNDFRLAADSRLRERDFVYGLVPANRDRIKAAQNIANPGCFATAIQQGLIPLAAGELLQGDVHIHAITGSTGAGTKPQATTHFSWRNNNLSIYKAFRHQHLGEIGETITRLQPGFEQSLRFLPLRGDFTRGIFASIYTHCDLEEKALLDLYQRYYQDAPFTRITRDTIHLKQVVNTNNCLIQVQKIDGQALITVVIDNLLKGASGQAVQNLNLMAGLPETTGLMLKAAYF
jgi:N-acetyl-gamma-glutamyl-phosphate reductase